MVKPYGRGADVAGIRERDVELSDAELSTPVKLDSAADKHRDSKVKETKVDAVPVAPEDHSVTLLNTVDLKKLNEANDKPLFPVISSNKSSTPSTSLIPPLDVINEDLEPAESLPFALVPVEPASNGNVVTSTPKDQQQSSLRAGRTRTTAVHASSAPRRPNGAPDKRPNRFAIDDEEGADDDKAEAEEAELKKWASKSGIALEVPTGWSFGGPKLPSVITLAPTTSDTVSTASSSAFIPVRSTLSIPSFLI